MNERVSVFQHWNTSALSGLGCGRKGIWCKTCQIGCADHSAVATSDKGSKPKEERDVIQLNYEKLNTQKC